LAAASAWRVRSPIMWRSWLGSGGRHVKSQPVGPGHIGNGKIEALAFHQRRDERDAAGQPMNLATSKVALRLLAGHHRGSELRPIVALAAFHLRTPRSARHVRYSCGNRENYSIEQFSWSNAVVCGGKISQFSLSRSPDSGFDGSMPRNWSIIAQTCT